MQSFIQVLSDRLHECPCRLHIRTGRSWLFFLIVGSILLCIIGTGVPASAGYAPSPLLSPVLLVTTPSVGSGGWEIYGIHSDALHTLPGPVDAVIRGIFSVLLFVSGVDGDSFQLKWIKPHSAPVDGGGEEVTISGPVQPELPVEGAVTPIPFNTQPVGEDSDAASSLPGPGTDSELGSKADTETIPPYGGIFINSYPSGIPILLDGKSLGVLTPKVIFGITEGSHTVRLDNDNDIFTVYEQKVWVYKGMMSRVDFDIDQEVKKTIKVDSKEPYSGDQFTVNGKYPAYRIPASITLKEPESYLTILHNGSYITREISDFLNTGSTMAILHTADTYGTIRVISDPEGADVLVDGFVSGLKTPCIVTNLSAGRHLLSVSKLGYLPSELPVRVIDDPANDVDGEVTSNLEPYIYGELSINSTPAGATVTIEKFNFRRTTPCLFPYMVPGSYSMKITRGGGTRAMDVEVAPMKRRDYDYDFTRYTFLVNETAIERLKK